MNSVHWYVTLLCSVVVSPAEVHGRFGSESHASRGGLEGQGAAFYRASEAVQPDAVGPQRSCHPEEHQPHQSGPGQAAGCPLRHREPSAGE